MCSMSLCLMAPLPSACCKNFAPSRASWAWALSNSKNAFSLGTSQESSRFMSTLFKKVTCLKFLGWVLGSARLEGVCCLADPLLIGFGIALALVFDFGYGFNDAANSISTIVSTRVLPPWK